MRKVLIITYHFPPIGLAGSVRWTKFSKYLPRLGFEPIILTVKPISYYFYDPDLLDEIPDIKIFRSESLDPARIFHRFKGTRTISPRLTRSSLLLHQIFFPDAKSPWIPFAYNLGCHVIEHEQPDIIIATAPPYSSLVLGLLFKKKFSLPLVLEFRDPWPTSIYPPKGYQKKFLERLRGKLLLNADKIITVSRDVTDDLGITTEVISHGYDPDDYEATAEMDGLIHIGATYEYETELLQFIKSIYDQQDIEFTLIGSTSTTVRNLITKTKNCHFLGLLPHRKAMSVISKASILVYFYAKEGPYLTSKFYEFLGARRPILAISPKTQGQQSSIGKYKVGITIPPKQELIRTAIADLMTYKGMLLGQHEQYNFVNLTKELARTFNYILRSKTP